MLGLEIGDRREGKKYNRNIFPFLKSPLIFICFVSNMPPKVQQKPAD